MQFDSIQKFGRDGMDAAVRSLGALAKGAQVAGTETTDYAKRSIENGTAVVEKLAGVRTLDRVLEIQSEFARTSYEGFVSQASKMGELMTSTAKEALAPVESLISKAPQRA